MNWPGLSDSQTSYQPDIHQVIEKIKHGLREKQGGFGFGTSKDELASRMSFYLGPWPDQLHEIAMCSMRTIIEEWIHYLDIHFASLFEFQHRYVSLTSTVIPVQDYYYIYLICR